MVVVAAVLAAPGGASGAGFVSKSSDGEVSYVEDTASGDILWSQADYEKAQRALGHQAFEQGATGEIALANPGSAPTAAGTTDDLTEPMLLLREAGNKLDPQKGSRIRRGLQELARHLRMTPSEARPWVRLFAVAGSFRLGYWTGTQARLRWFNTGKYGAGPRIAVTLHMRSKGDELFYPSSSLQPAYQPGDGWGINVNYHPYWEWGPFNAVERVPGGCRSADNRPGLGLSIPMYSNFSTEGWGGACERAEYKREGAWIGPIDPKPSKPGTEPGPDAVGPEPGTSGSGDAPVVAPNPMTPEEQLAELLRLLNSQWSSEELREAIRWILSQPNSGLPPRARPIDPADPRCNTGSSLRVPTPRSDESFASYAACLKELGLAPDRVAVSYADADISRHPETVLHISPPEGTSVAAGETVIVTTNPALTGTLRAATDALIRDNPSDASTVEFKRDVAPIVAQECLKLAARSRTIPATDPDAGNRVPDSDCGNSTSRT